MSVVSSFSFCHRAASQPRVPCVEENSVRTLVFNLAAGCVYRWGLLRGSLPLVFLTKLSPQTHNPPHSNPSFYVVHQFPYYIYCSNAANSFYIGFSVRFLLGKRSI